jgi:N-methylhydantoinase B/oxoprolinase/acetone carboxylase alpha subunit
MKTPITTALKQILTSLNAEYGSTYSDVFYNYKIVPGERTRVVDVKFAWMEYSEDTIQKVISEMIKRGYQYVRHSITRYDDGYTTGGTRFVFVQINKK